MAEKFLNIGMYGQIFCQKLISFQSNLLKSDSLKFIVARELIKI